MQKYLLYILSTLLCCLCACTQTQQQADVTNLSYTTQPLQYAQHFSLQQASNYTLLTIHNPWHKDQLIGKYYLVTHDSISTPTDGTKLIVPLSTLCIQSAPHIGYIDALGQTHRVTGACSPQLFYSPTLQQLYQQGQVAHLGDAYQMKLEKITQLQPQAMLITAYPQGDTQTHRLQTQNIAVIPTVEWTEPNLLARAEWIKVYGALLGCNQLADSLFTHTVNTYQHLQQTAQRATNTPQIMSGLPYKDTWYMPGGNSFMGQLFKHANVAYHYSQNQQTSSLPLSIESVFYHFIQADIWVGIDADSQAQLLQIDTRLKEFKAVKNNQLYHYRKRITPTGGNDFWESAVVFPQRLLQDLIVVAHPYLLPTDTTYYIGYLP